MSLKVEDVMRSSVVTIEGEYSARQAAKMMDFKGVSSLVVVSKKKISGIVTERSMYEGDGEREGCGESKS